MNTLLHFLLRCQSCRSLRNVSFGGRTLGLIKSDYHGWLSMMTSSEGPFLVLGGPRAPTLKPTTVQMTLSLSLATFFRPNSSFVFYSLQHHVQIRRRRNYEQEAVVVV